MKEIGDRMKEYYENAYRINLPMRIPVILRLDGKCFHSWAKRVRLVKPFDFSFHDTMLDCTKILCQEIGMAVFAYVQSDEVSILIHNYKKLGSQSWFGNNLQKMVSVASSIMSSEMTLNYDFSTYFDCRAFVLPESEVGNYFYFRQLDATRNSIQSLAQASFSHKQLLGLDTNKLQDKLMVEKRINWNDQPTCFKRGSCLFRGEFPTEEHRDSSWLIDKEIPLFNKNWDYIYRHFKVLEE